MSSTHKLPSSPHEWQDLAKRNGLIAKANDHLADYSSWKTYCDGLARGTISESTFALAHYFQLQAADTWDETWAPNVAVTPIAHRTRSKTTVLERQLSRTHLETPTKSTGILLDDSDSEEELDDTESPLASTSPGPEEIQNLIYRQTKDEQIVNTDRR
ncbi:hypothetical protein AJ79_09181 [Helicocarpus griseus UAMH5409]|uniref:Uncharacterized protein n=1 Tax=Helicocarpus griseus UAMH5409 TaxID=1447875 RepID=A0A2B7WLX1_9EURO|nr:hypothetical protein AJ79_09181 [Helicocarpus griseus UAMH5409]